MSPKSQIGLSIAASAALIATSALAQDGGRKFETMLSGAAEVPGPGDTDGSGTASVTVNAGQRQLCFKLSVSSIAAATAAHVHIGGKTVAGPVSVGLTAPTDGKSSGCVTITRDLAQAIIKDPANYYVNVHNAEFPAGAVRGQLSK